MVFPRPAVMPSGIQPDGRSICDGNGEAAATGAGDDAQGHRDRDEDGQGSAFHLEPPWHWQGDDGGRIATDLVTARCVRLPKPYDGSPRSVLWRRGVDNWRRAVYSTARLYNQVVMDMQQTDPLSTTFAALADPTRRAILARLAKGEASVKDLAAPFDMSQPAISKHLRVLERAGLIEQGRQAQWRPRRLQAGPLREIADWVNQYRRHWEESFERLDAYLREVQDTRSKEMETPTMTANGSTGVAPRPRPSTRRGATSSSSAPSTPRASGSGRPSPIPRSSPAGGARTARPRRSSRWTSDRAASGATSAAQPIATMSCSTANTSASRRPRASNGRSCSMSTASARRAARSRTGSRTSAGRPGSSPSGHMGSPEAIEGALATGMAKGAIETWDRLEAFLAEG